jgi:hypothetical protein
MSNKSKVVHYEHPYKRNLSLCWHSWPQIALRDWSKVTCNKCLAKRKEIEQ